VAARALDRKNVNKRGQRRGGGRGKVPKDDTGWKNYRREGEKISREKESGKGKKKNI